MLYKYLVICQAFSMDDKISFNGQNVKYSIATRIEFQQKRCQFLWGIKKCNDFEQIYVISLDRSNFTVNLNGDYILVIH